MVLGLALLTLAFLDKPDGLIGGLELHDLVLGLLVFPTASVLVGVLARRYHDGPLRFTGTAGIDATFAVLVALFAVP